MLTKKFLCLSLCLFSLTAVSTAYAENGVEKILRLTREALPTTKLPDGTLIGKETPEEKLRPIIPAADAVRIIKMATRSAKVAWCNMDWEELVYVPLLKEEIAKNTWSDKQIAYIGTLYGVAMKELLPLFGASGKECSKSEAAALKKAIEAEDQQ